ncbi:MAG TPA: DUF6786 family protein [Pirellulales bacterium]|jgi:hypothetical protein|nr:DUF6786 family protein [Pirellulales bacterium]
MTRLISALSQAASLASLAMLFPATIAGAAEAAGTDAKGDSMTYRQAKEFLAKHTKVIELTHGAARVAICPEYQGRVMTSTCDGEDGRSLGWINRAFIEAGKPNPQFNNYGGEDRIWLSPEGGQFSLWFAPGAKQELANWYTPPAMNDGAFQVVASDANPVIDAPNRPAFCRMERAMQLTNAAKTEFGLVASRTIRLLESGDFATCFGGEAQSALAEGKLHLVGFQSENSITNRGAAMKKDGGLVSIWILGMMVSGPETVVIVPYRSGDESTLGPVVKGDYFGPVPPERLKITPAAILFRGDSHYRSKIGVSQRRVKPIAGSIDFQAGVLTLVNFDMPADPADHLYTNNAWEVPQAHPFVGDALNSYNDGPPGAGRAPLGAFYEVESLSPAAELAHGQSLAHHHRTFHIQGDLAALARLAKITLGVDLDSVRKEMLGE